MIEVFAGGAVLTSIAKHSGLGGIAIDKTRKPNALYNFSTGSFEGRRSRTLGGLVAIPFTSLRAFRTSVRNSEQGSRDT
jgi:hypothetical protein